MRVYTDKSSIAQYIDPQEETKEIISIGSNAVGGKFDATVKGNTATNLISNGNFADGTTGWTGLNGTLSAANNTISLTGNGTSSIVALRDSLPLNENEVKSLRLRFRVTNSDCQSVSLYLGGNVILDTIDNPVINQWYTLYGKGFSATNRTYTAYVHHVYADAATANGKALEVQEVFSIDMGIDSSNEFYNLTADQMNERFPSYFDGTKSTDKSRVKLVGKNLFDGKVELGDINSLTGLDTASTARNRTGFYKAKENTNYTMSPTGTNRFQGVFFYDSNKVPIAIPTTFYIAFITADSTTFTTPSGCAYVRFRSISILTDEAIQSILLETGSTATTYVPFSSTQATCPVKLNSLPNGVADEWEVDTGKITKNVEEYVLQSADIISISTNVNQFVNLNFLLNQKIITGGSSLIGNFLIPNKTEYRNSEATTTNAQNNFVVGSSGAISFVFALGTYATLIDAQTALAGTVIYYQLATPEISYTQPAILNAEANGTVYVEPYIAEDKTAQFYSTGLVLDSAYPLSSLNDIDEINKYDLSTGLVTPIPISDLTLASSTSITISGALASDFYAVSYNYRNLSTIGTLEYSYSTNTIGTIKDLVENVETLDGKIDFLERLLLPIEKYQDLQFQISAGKVPAANFPDFTAFTTNTNEYAFGVNEYIDLSANEPPHDHKLGQTATFHLHLAPKSANATGSDRFAKFELDVAYVSMGGTWAETVITAEITIPDGTGALDGLFLLIGSIDLSNVGIGGQIKPRIRRIAATGGTEFADDIFITQLGMHYISDGNGSETPTRK